MRVVERTIDKTGQVLLTPEIELEGWWTSLPVSDKDIVQLYADHGTSEQYMGCAPRGVVASAGSFRRRQRLTKPVSTKP